MPSLQAAVADSAEVLPASFGNVHHFALPGAFNATPPSIGNGTVDGVLNIFLKALRSSDGHLCLRGFFFFDPTQEPEHFKRQPILRQVPLRNVPEIWRHLMVGVRSAAGGWSHIATLDTPFCAHIPAQRSLEHQRCSKQDPGRNRLKPVSYYDFPSLHLQLDSNASAAATDMELFIQGWPRYVSLAGLLRSAAQEAGPSASTEVAAAAGGGDKAPLRPVRHLQTYTFGLDVCVVAQLLEWRLARYKRAGIDNILMYVKPADLPAYQDNPRIAALVRQGSLLLVDWQVLPYFEGWPYLDQQVVLAHGVLSHWGSGMWLLVADLDEFPVLSGGHLPTMLASGCLSRYPHCMRLPVHNVFPGRNGSATAEPQLWRGKEDPLPRYHLRSKSSLGQQTKMLIDSSSTVFGVTPHQASVCSANVVSDVGSAQPVSSGCNATSSCFLVERQCAWVGHVFNMHRTRAEPGKDAVAIYPPLS